MEALKKYYH